MHWREQGCRGNGSRRGTVVWVPPQGGRERDGRSGGNLDQSGGGALNITLRHVGRGYASPNRGR